MMPLVRIRIAFLNFTDKQSSVCCFQNNVDVEFSTLSSVAALRHVQTVSAQDRLACRQEDILTHLIVSETAPTEHKLVYLSLSLLGQIHPVHRRGSFLCAKACIPLDSLNSNILTDLNLFAEEVVSHINFNSICMYRGGMQLGAADTLVSDQGPVYKGEVFLRSCKAP